MAVATTDTLVHLPFADRPDFSDPYPEGLAVGHADVTGDASGGGVASALQSVPRFLYRLELLNATKGSVVVNGANFILGHRWAADQSGFGATAFDLNWIPEQAVNATFSTYNPFPGDLEMIRRFPAGRTAGTGPYTLASYNWNVNEDTVVYDVDWVFSYWSTEALQRPGFLTAFYESPFIPLPRR